MGWLKRLIDRVNDDGSGTARTYSFRSGTGGIAWGPAE